MENKKQAIELAQKLIKLMEEKRIEHGSGSMRMSFEEEDEEQFKVSVALTVGRAEATSYGYIDLDDLPEQIISNIEEICREVERIKRK